MAIASGTIRAAERGMPAHPAHGRAGGRAPRRAGPAPCGGRGRAARPRLRPASGLLRAGAARAAGRRRGRTSRMTRHRAPRARTARARPATVVRSRRISLCEAADAVANGDLSATDLVEAALARIDRLDPAAPRLRPPGALRTRWPERRRWSATGAAARLCRFARGRAHGPQGHVLSRRQGFRLRLPHQAGFSAGRDGDGAGSPGQRRAPSTSAASPWSSSPWGPTASTPTCRAAATSGISGRIPCGSSSGSGTAVAGRLVYAALGSDTGGSIRCPAAANGIAGINPTMGRVSRFGCMPMSWSLDVMGPLARTVRDCARVLGVDRRRGRERRHHEPGAGAGLRGDHRAERARRSHRHSRRATSTRTSTRTWPP